MVFAVAISPVSSASMPSRRSSLRNFGSRATRARTASPKPANHTSPGRGLIEQVQNFLFDCPRARHIENGLVSEFDDFLVLGPEQPSGLHSRSFAFSLSTKASSGMPPLQGNSRDPT